MRTSLTPSSPFLQFYDPFNASRGGWKKGQPRVFAAALDSGELSDMKFLLENLARKSWIRLLTMQKELKKRGAQLVHIHPLTFIMGVLSPSCKYLFKELRDRGGRPFNAFVKGAIGSFQDEKKHGNVTNAQLQVFANTTGKDIHTLRSFANSESWDGLIKWLCEGV